MSDVDDRVVSITFDNADFERKIEETIASLDRLRDSLDFSDALTSFQDLSSVADKVDFSGVAQSLDGVSTAADNIDLDHIGTSLDTIKAKFSTLGAVGFSVIQKLTQDTVGFVEKLLHLGSENILGPILTGGKRRALNIEQAKFMFQGLGIDVTQAMDSAKKAVLGTAFGLDEAAKAAAQFGASGIKVGDEMYRSLRGVAGAAALTGSSFTEIADIFAGSAGSGKVTNQDLLQFSTRGLNAAAAIAPILHTTEAGIHELATNGELDFKTFADAMDKAFGAHAQEANKTFAGSLSNLHAAMSRLGATFFTPSLTQQRDLFNALTPLVDKFSAAISPLVYQLQVLAQIHFDQVIKFVNGLDLTNLTKAIPNFADAFRQTYIAIAQIVAAIKVGFDDVFPPGGESLILKISEALKKFTLTLESNKETLEKVRQVAKAFFEIVKVLFVVLKILWDVFRIGFAILREVFLIFGNIIAAIAPGTGSVLTFAEAVGKMADKITDFLTTGGAIHRFFVSLSALIVSAIGFIGKIISKIEDFFGVVGHSEIAEAGVGRVQTRLENLAAVPGKLIKAWNNFRDRFTGIFDFFDRIGTTIGNTFQSLPDKIAGALKGAKYDNVFDALNVGIFGALAIALYRFFHGGILNKLVKVIGGGNLFSSITGALNSVTVYLHSLTQQVKSNTLLKIAYAVGILAAAMLVLSLINSKDLTKALAAMTVGITDIVGAMILLDKQTGSKGKELQAGGKLALLGVAINEIAAAMVVLAFAVTILGHLKPDELARGLAGLTAGLLAITFAVREIGKSDTPVLASSGAAIYLIAKALQVLGKAVQEFAAIDYWDLAHGLGAIAVGLTLLVGAMRLMPNTETVLKGAFSIGVMSLSLLLLARVVKKFAGIDYGELAKGVRGIAAALFTVVLAMRLMPNTESLVAGATAIFIISTSLLILARAVKKFGSIDLITLAKGLGAIDIVLGSIAGTLYLMQGSISGAFALVIVAGAMLIFAKVIKTLGHMKFGDLAKGLGAFIAVMLTIAGVSIVLSEAIPLILAFGIAVGAVGLSVALIGHGIYSLAKAFVLFAIVGDKGVKGFIKAVKALGAGAVEIAKTAGKIAFALLDQLNKLTPPFLEWAAKTLYQLAAKIIQDAPIVFDALGVLIDNLLALVETKSPDIIEAGIKFILRLLEGMGKKATEFTNAVINLVTTVLNTIADRASDLADAGANMVIAILTGMGNRVQDIIDAGVWFIGQIVGGMAQAITTISTDITNIVISLLGLFKNQSTLILQAGTEFIVKFLEGMGSTEQKVLDALSTFATGFVKNLGHAIDRTTNELAKIMARFMNKLADTIDENAPEVHAAMVHLAKSILNGIAVVFTGKDAKSLIGVTKNLALDLIKNIALPWFVASPSKTMIKLAKQILAGLRIPFEQDDSVAGSAYDLSERTVAGFRDQLKKITYLSDIGDINPVIAPVLDLSTVQRQAGGINDLLSANAIAANLSLSNARAIVSATTATATETSAQAQAAAGDLVFNQTINSPKSLSTNDIYRNTKSQIAIAKEKLGIS